MTYQLEDYEAIHHFAPENDGELVPMVTLRKVGPRQSDAIEYVIPYALANCHLRGVGNGKSARGTKGSFEPRPFRYPDPVAGYSVVHHFPSFVV